MVSIIFLISGSLEEWTMYRSSTWTRPWMNTCSLWDQPSNSPSYTVYMFARHTGTIGSLSSHSMKGKTKIVQGFQIEKLRRQLLCICASVSIDKRQQFFTYIVSSSVPLFHKTHSHWNWVLQWHLCRFIGDKCITPCLLTVGNNAIHNLLSINIQKLVLNIWTCLFRISSWIIRVITQGGIVLCYQCQ